MLAYMNRERFRKHSKRGNVYLQIASKTWFKGDTSGHVQKVREVYVDCDGDALLFKSNRQAQPVLKTTTCAFFAEETTISANRADKYRRVMLR
jgi:phosphoribosyl-AMP cyclohydrolase